MGPQGVVEAPRRRLVQKGGLPRMQLADFTGDVRIRVSRQEGHLKVEERRWYSQGLRFECTQCGNCCTGAPGFVWVTEEEIAAIAGMLGEPDIARFEKLFVRQVKDRKSLVEFPNGDCVFFDNQRRTCRVYSERPRQCRTWPFWDSNLKTPEAWKQTCEICPGSSQGKLYDITQIEKMRGTP